MSLNGALGLGFIFEAKDLTSEVIEKLHGGFEKLGKAGEMAGNSITTALGMSTKALIGTSVALGAIAAGGAFEFAEHAEKFSSAIRQAGIASHATTEQMRGLEEFAKSKSLDSLTGSAIGMAETLRELALEGFNAHEAAQALDGTLRLVKISMGALSTKDAAGLVHDTAKQFHMDANETSKMVDKFAVSMQLFGFRAEELRGAFSTLAAGAQLVGASFDDTLIGAGLIKEVFPSATKASGALNVAMQQLANPRVQRELQAIGVAATDATGKILPSIQIYEQLAKQTANMTDAQVAHRLQTVAGGKAAGGLSAIIDGLRRGVKDASGQIHTGGDAIAYLREQMEKSEGAAKKMADMLGSDMGGGITALKNAISNLGVAIGLGFEGPFGSAIKAANLFVRGLTQLFSQGGFSGDVKDALDKNLGLKGFVTNVFIWVERLKHFFSSIGSSFKAAFEPFKPVLDVLSDTFSKLGRALGLTSQTAGANASTWDSFGQMGARVGSVLGNIAGAVLPILNYAMHIAINAVEELQSVWQAIKPAVMSVFQVLSGVFKLLAGLMTGDWKMMWDGLVDTVVGAAKLVINAVFAMVSRVTQMIDRMAGAFGADLHLTKSLQDFQAELNTGVDAGTMVLKSVVSPSSPAAGAVAQTQAHRAALQDFHSNFTRSDDDKPTFLQTSVHLDGEKIAEVQARAKRSSHIRGFDPVPAGGF